MTSDSMYLSVSDDGDLNISAVRTAMLSRYVVGFFITPHVNNLLWVELHTDVSPILTHKAAKEIS